MRTLVISFILLGLASGAAFAANTSAPLATTTKKATKSKAVKQSPTSSLSTDVKFGDQSVGGKYQLPMEALSVVENEKSIDDLIGVRKNFRDRVARSKGMR